MKKRNVKSGLLALGICASLILQTPVFGESAVSDPAASPGITTNAIAGWPQGPDITSTAAVVLEDSTNTILYAKNMDTQLYPASAVKIMTCLLILENCQLTDQVTMTATGVSGVTDGGANISSQVDEIFTIEQCLYAIMVASANDIALQVAEHIGGSVEGFVEKMNARAQELGCTNTLFTNPTGLPDENQHTTAHDMALITREAMDNETFQNIARATSYTIPATNVSGGERVLTSNFTMTNATSDAYYEGCLGGKEGFTTASGSTLVCAARRNGMTLTCVVLNGTSGQTDDEAITLLDYGFANFQMMDLGESDFSVASGGNVVVPAGTAADAIVSQDTGEGDQLSRTYYFGDVAIGTAVLESTQESVDAVIVDGDANMEAARLYTENKSQVPYYLIAAGGLLLFILCIWGIVKVAKS